MELSIFTTISNARKLAMKTLSILTLLVCSDCAKTIGGMFDLISESEDLAKNDKQ